MSGKLTLEFKVENMTIMEETLKRLGHNFTKKENTLSIDRPYYPIIISEEKVSCDTMDNNLVAHIKSEYQRDFQILERTLRGESFEMTETNEEIVITVF